MHHPTLSPHDLERLSAVENRLRYAFHDKSILAVALTHSSWANEHGTEHNERLEFLGDAVLELNISREIYKRFPNEREGEMTRLRSLLVSEEKLAGLARELNLGDSLLMSRGEEAQGGRMRPALIADALEAVLGAVYLDGGNDAASALIDRLYSKQWSSHEHNVKTKDYKTRLQEITQASLHALPVYALLSSSGPEHARIFRVRLDLPDGRIFTASGGSVKRAEQEAARLALECVAKEKIS